jgi:hypothetical protein
VSRPVVNPPRQPAPFVRQCPPCHPRPPPHWHFATTNPDGRACEFPRLQFPRLQPKPASWFHDVTPRCRSCPGVPSANLPMDFHARTIHPALHSSAALRVSNHATSHSCPNRSRPRPLPQRWFTQLHSRRSCSWFQPRHPPRIRPIPVPSAISTLRKVGSTQLHLLRSCGWFQPRCFPRTPTIPAPSHILDPHVSQFHAVAREACALSGPGSPPLAAQAALSPVVGRAVTRARSGVGNEAAERRFQNELASRPEC